MTIGPASSRPGTVVFEQSYIVCSIDSVMSMKKKNKEKVLLLKKTKAILQRPLCNVYLRAQLLGAGLNMRSQVVCKRVSVTTPGALIVR